MYYKTINKIKTEKIIWNDRTKIELLHNFMAWRNHEPKFHTIERILSDILNLNLSNSSINGSTFILHDVTFQFKTMYYKDGITHEVLKYLSRYISSGIIMIFYEEDLFEHDITYFFIFTNGKIIKKKTCLENGYKEEYIGEF